MNNAIVKESVIDYICSDMGTFGIDRVELMERITVKLDEEQFNYKEDESVWLQKKGKTTRVCEVYFDDVFCCDLRETDIKTTMQLKFFRGFLKGYESGKIRLNRFLNLLNQEKEKDALERVTRDRKADINALPSSTPEEKMSKDIIKELDKENDGKASFPSSA